jgi:hypothetical protein
MEDTLAVQAKREEKPEPGGCDDPMSSIMRVVSPARKGIQGWELGNPDPEIFDTRIIEVFGACKDCFAREMCGAPSESIRELVPKSGEIVELGSECNGEGERSSYYALLSSRETRYILAREPKYLWARAFMIPEEQVPGRVLSALSRRRKSEVA